MSGLSIPELYPYILMVVSVIVFECWFIGFVTGGKERQVIYTKEHMETFR